MSDQNREMAITIGKVLKEKGVLFAGLDMIGNHVTEINVTSPTCVRELDEQCGLDIAGDLMSVLEVKLNAGR